MDLLDFDKLVDLEISCRGPWLKRSGGPYLPSYGPGRFFGFLTLHGAQPGPGTCPTWTRDMPNLDQGHAQPGPGMGPTWTRHGPNLDQARASTWTRHGPQPGPQNHLSEHGFYLKNFRTVQDRIQGLPKSRPGGLPKVQADSCVDFK